MLKNKIKETKNTTSLNSSNPLLIDEKWYKYFIFLSLHKSEKLGQVIYFIKKFVRLEYAEITPVKNLMVV